MTKPDIFNIIPKPKKIIPKWVNFAIGFSLVMILTVVGLFAFYYYQALSWKSKLEMKESDYLALNNPENRAMEMQVSLISQKLEKFSQAFLSRKVTYNFFDFVGNFCHPKVSFSDLSLDIENGNVSLIGQTDTYKSLSEQIIILKDVKETNNLVVSDISLSKEGSVSFRISFVLDPTFFKNRNQ
ncbi:MAG: hypothetical protein Q7R99_00375 [bacterium]|nr:hypothetical protein [bacterium]